MIRLLLVIGLPLLAPFLVYGLYVWLARRGKPAATAEGGPAPQPDAQRWVWLLFAGVCLSAVSLFLLGLERGVAPGTKLLPPAFVDGEVVPSRPADQ